MDLQLREWVRRVAKGEPLETLPDKPEGFPRLSLIMIVKNEWATLERCVHSIAPCLDELIIGVDRETDESIAFAYEEAFARKNKYEAFEYFAKFLPENRYATMEEIAEYIGMPVEELRAASAEKSLARPTMAAALRCLELVGKGEVFEIDFNANFSESRNLTLAKATGEIILYLDGHEYCENAMSLFRTLTEEAPNLDWHFGYVRLDERDVDSRTQIVQNRMFKNVPGVRFERGVHNKVIIPSLEEDKSESEPLALSPMLLVHERPDWLAAFRKTQRQDMTEKYMGEGDDTGSLYFAGLSAFSREDWDRALEKFDEYLAKSPRGAESAYIAWLKGRALELEKKDPDAAEAAWLDGTRRFPNAAWLWLELSRLYMDKASKIKDNPEERREVADFALSYARLAAGCELIVPTVAIPTTCFTWEPLVRLAEIYGFIKDYDNATEFLARALEYRDSIPSDTLGKIDGLIGPTRKLAAKKASDDARVSKKSKKRMLAIFDRSLQFTRDVLEVAQEIGLEVEVYQQFEPRVAYRADIWWCDWADESAFLASRTYRDDRKLIVRCHSAEAFTDWPGQILWRNVDIPLVAAKNTQNRLASCFGIDTERFQTLTVYPNPDEFKKPTENRQNVALVGRVNQKKGFELLPDLAALLPERKILVGGTVEDERLYEQIVERSVAMGVSNLNFMGHLSALERNDFYCQAGHYVSLSPWETLSVACCEAELCGLPVYTLDYEWAGLQQPKTYHRYPTLPEMADAIRSGEALPPARETNERRYSRMKEKIRAILAA